MTPSTEERRVEVELANVSKRFDRGAGAALRDISLSVLKGELMVLVGPSGCGKSTTLRILAGLEQPDEGRVAIAGMSVEDVPPQDRDIAMVFQGYALYPQMTVRENIEFPLRMRRVPASERARRTAEAAAMLRLERLLDRLPAELSGGERQRVAMGRAIVRRPRVFLFDEPLSNLDAALRQDLRVELGSLVRTLGATAIYVTHDHVEAMTLGDRICVMDKGRILQVATPRRIYEEPSTSFVATFLGTPRMNLLRATTEGAEVIAGPFRFSSRGLASAGLPKEVTLGIRPEDVLLSSSAPVCETTACAYVDVVLTEPLGAESHVLVRGGETELRARTSGFDTRTRNDRVCASFDVRKVHVFDPSKGGERIA